MEKHLIPLAILIAISTAAPAVAQPMADVSETVDYSDLNLSTARGQKALQNRVEFAIAHVCVEPADSSPADLVQQDQCKKWARRQANEALAARGVFGPRQLELAKEAPASRPRASLN